MDSEREPRRVAYLLSYPEWYGHNVNDMFFRLEDWLFVPVQDLNSEQRLEEYRKATYFFVSGRGQSQEAVRASEAGCIVVGPRADVPAQVPVVNCTEWDPVDAYVTFLFVEWFHSKFPWMIRPSTVRFSKVIIKIFQTVLRPFFKVFYLSRAAYRVWRTQGLHHVITKTKNYFKKVMGVSL